MGRLLAYMGNDPQRLRCALHPGRAHLVSSGAGVRFDGWGVGFYQGGEVLLQRRPKPFTGPFDLYQQLQGVASDALLAQVRLAAPHAAPGDAPKNENTPPFRFRSWLFAHHGAIPRFEERAADLLAPVPDYLRRNIRGQTDSEALFHLFLAGLHGGGQVNDPDLPPRRAAQALAEALAHVDRVVGDAPVPFDVAATNGRVLVALRRGRPMHHYRINGLRSCPVCHEAPPTLGGWHAADHEHLRAVVIVASDGDERPAAPWEEVPDGSLVTVSRDLHVEIVPIGQLVAPAR